MADEKDLRILNVSFSHGSVHDFRLFCRSRVYFSKDVLLIADKGYIGMVRYTATAWYLKNRQKSIN